MHRVRLSVRENRLTSSSVMEADYVPAIEATGRGWVIETDNEIVGFAIGNATNGNIWALFVHPNHERRGYGRQLHDVMVGWLFSCGLEVLWLTTDPGTRAQSFYAAAGWQPVGSGEDNAVRFELRRSDYRIQPAPTPRGTRRG